MRQYSDTAQGHVAVEKSAGRKRKLSDEFIDQLTEHALENRDLQNCIKEKCKTRVSKDTIFRGILRRTAFIDEFSIDTRMKRKTRVKRLSVD